MRGRGMRDGNPIRSEVRGEDSKQVSPQGPMWATCPVTARRAFACGNDKKAMNCSEFRAFMSGSGGRTRTYDTRIMIPFWGGFGPLSATLTAANPCVTTPRWVIDLCGQSGHVIRSPPLDSSVLNCPHNVGKLMSSFQPDEPPIPEAGQDRIVAQGLQQGIPATTDFP